MPGSGVTWAQVGSIVRPGWAYVWSYVGPTLGLSMLALGWVYLCCHSGLSTLYWPHLPLMLAYVGPYHVSLFWPYLPLMLAHVAPMIVYVGAMRPQVGSIYYVVTQVCEPYIGPISPLRWPYGSLCEPILALSPPYVGPCCPYDSPCWCYEAPGWVYLCWP